MEQSNKMVYLEPVDGDSMYDKRRELPEPVSEKTSSDGAHSQNDVDAAP